MIAAEVKDVSRYGALVLAKDKVIGFSEKGNTGPGYINAGYYVFNLSQVKSFPSQNIFSLEEDFLQKDIIMHPYDFIQSRGRFIDIGIPEDYLKAQIELREFSL
jgi:D-glycero-alpha-D-manno-heptose 1-phosphate guanylyltransferase